MLKGFKDFIMRGNVVDLAVAVVIGVSFGLVITAIVDGLITPVVAAIFGRPNFSDVLAFTINNATFRPGLALTAIVNFIAIAAAIYFIVIVPMNALAARRGAVEEVAEPEDVTLLREIRDALRAKN